jgi:hypothetical protein
MQQDAEMPHCALLLKGSDITSVTKQALRIARSRQPTSILTVPNNVLQAQ